VSRPVTPLAAVDDPWLTLTKSELRVMKLIVSGMTNREAADKLFLSPHTVDTHLRHVFEKVGVNSRVRLSSLYFSRSAASERPDS
jgi:DNA-binding CsgD family transcriptional regulator